MTDFTFSHPLRVRWAEVDPQGVVFNGNYLTYFDVGVTEWYRAIGCPYPAGGFVEHGSDVFARKAEIEFHAPARYDELVDVLVRAARLGRTSFELAVEIRREGTLLVSGKLVYVNVDVKSGRPAPIPAFLREAITRFEKTSPAES